MTTLSQALSIAKWINKFNPEQVTFNDLVLPQELQSYQNLVTDTFDDIKDLAVAKDNNFEMK